MSLYILAVILIAIGAGLFSLSQGNAYGDTWAGLLVLSGFAFAIVRSAIDLRSFL